MWLLIFGLIGGVSAAMAGDMAGEAAEEAGIAESLIEWHETLAFVTLGIFGFLLLWKLIKRDRLTTFALTAYFLVAAIGFGTLGVMAHLGGDLVYEHGAGVKVATRATPEVAKTPEEP